MILSRMTSIGTTCGVLVFIMLQRIEILCVSSTGIISLDDVGNSPSSSSSDDNSTNSFTNTGLIEIINIEPGKFNNIEIFKSIFIKAQPLTLECNYIKTRNVSIGYRCPLFSPLSQNFLTDGHAI